MRLTESACVFVFGCALLSATPFTSAHAICDPQMCVQTERIVILETASPTKTSEKAPDAEYDDPEQPPPPPEERPPYDNPGGHPTACYMFTHKVKSTECTRKGSLPRPCAPPVWETLATRFLDRRLVDGDLVYCEPKLFATSRRGWDTNYVFEIKPGDNLSRGCIGVPNCKSFFVADYFTSNATTMLLMPPYPEWLGADRGYLTGTVPDLPVGTEITLDIRARNKGLGGDRLFFKLRVVP